MSYKLKQIPAGQARPYPRIKMVKHGEDGSLPVYIYPHEVVSVRSVKDLDAALEHYGHPIPTMANSPFIKTEHGLRYLVEWVYPALRWFCRVYGEDIPDWLKGNHWADRMTDKDMKEYFGKEPLQVKEWHEDKNYAGVRA